MRALVFTLFVSLVTVTSLACNGDDTMQPDIEVLDPEPSGAPSDAADGRLSCLGSNAPEPASGTNLTLPGWVRALADPANTGGVQPTAEVDVLDPTGLSLGMAFSDTSNGRVAVQIPTRASGFEGTVVVTADGYVTTTLASSHAYTSTSTAAWVWLPTPDERTSLAEAAGVTVEAGKGIVVGAVHDCDVFGVANAVIRWNGSTDGVVYFEGFTPVGSRTFTDPSGRFAIPNVDPGPVTVQAFGREAAGEPLLLLGRVDATVAVDEIAAVDIQPRAGVER
jgi:hypothetical protein